MALCRRAASSPAEGVVQLALEVAAPWCVEASHVASVDHAQSIRGSCGQRRPARSRAVQHHEEAVPPRPRWKLHHCSSWVRFPGTACGRPSRRETQEGRRQERLMPTSGGARSCGLPRTGRAPGPRSRAGPRAGRRRRFGSATGAPKRKPGTGLVEPLRLDTLVDRAPGAIGCPPHRSGVSSSISPAGADVVDRPRAGDPDLPVLEAEGVKDPQPTVSIARTLS